MKRSDLVNLFLLGALWGTSFLFMRIAAPEFGPAALSEIRVAVAALCLLPAVLLRGRMSALCDHWSRVATVGVFNSALPFGLLACSMLYLGGGLAAVINSSSPLFAGLIAWLWLNQRPGPVSAIGLLLGFLGVVMLMWNGGGHGPDHALPAMVAALAASACYGFAANYTRLRLAGVSPLAVAFGSQVAASLALLPLAAWSWPEAPVSPWAWAAAIVLGILCTGLAYLLYFRLIESAGASRAITVTFLVPVFAVLWGTLCLGEALTARMVLGGAVILAGLSLATGLVTPKRVRGRAQKPKRPRNPVYTPRPGRAKPSTSS